MQFGRLLKWLVRSKKIKINTPLNSAKNSAIAFIALFAVVGTVMLLYSFAATPYVSVESENGAPASGAITVNDDTSASNNGYVVFGKPPLRYEAEDAQTTATLVSSGKGYASNKALVGDFGTIGQFITFNVNVPATGMYAAYIRYASAFSGTVNSGPNPLPRTMIINGNASTVQFARTSNVADNWASLTTKSLGSVLFTSGNNTVTFRVDLNNFQYWDVDYLEVAGATAPVVCPAGTIGTPPNCSAQCPSGQTGTPPNCVTPCPTGTHGTYPNCIADSCPAGTIGTPPNCAAKPVFTINRSTTVAPFAYPIHFLDTYWNPSSQFERVEIDVTPEVAGGTDGYYFSNTIFFPDTPSCTPTCVAYMGLQTDGIDGRPGQGWIGKMALFSFWSAPPEAVPGPGGWSVPFSGEGTGYSVHIPYDWQVNNKYRFIMYRDDTIVPGQTYWTAIVINVTTGVWSTIGSIRAPAGITNGSSFASFHEIYKGSATCGAMNPSQAYFNNARIVLNGIWSDVIYRDHYQANVSGCNDKFWLHDDGGGFRSGVNTLPF